MQQERLRIGQFSAFYGDREDGIGQLIDTGVDVLVGDYLAELTMLVLRKNQLRGRPGYATGFFGHIAPELGRIEEQQIKVVTNAGGLDPVQCAEDLRAIIREQKLSLTVAAVTGDNITPALSVTGQADEPLLNMDTGLSLDVASSELLTANAYLGAWPIVEALTQGADIVVCPRVTDASVIMGPAAWHFGWSVDDWDELAGALVAGHVIECGAQVTGGQFSMFDEYENLGLPGMPIATMSADGSCVITRTAGESAGGVVDTHTVRAQLLYEVGSPFYENPDVVADFTSIRLQQLADDEVRISGTVGLPPSDRLKVSVAVEGGYRNTIVIGMTGGRIAAKRRWLESEISRAVGAPESFDGFRSTLVGPNRSEDGSYDDSTALLVVSAKDKDRARVGRAGFSGPITQIAVSNIPGFYLLAPPTQERMFAKYWPTTVRKSLTTPRVVHENGAEIEVPWSAPVRTERPEVAVTAAREVDELRGPYSDVLLRTLVGTRSGDKGGNANLGVWAKKPASWKWLRDTLTIDVLKQLAPELRDLRIERFELPNLNALNFVIFGYLEDGAASCLRVDAQAKGLGEYVGSQSISVPRSLLASAS